MYAAAGGASLASRQARQKQRQNKQKQQKNQKASDILPKPKQAQQFHNYTDDASVVAVPKLSRVERGTLKPPTPHERRHSTSNYHLKEACAPRARIRESPSISIPVQNHQVGHHGQPLTPCTLVQQNHMPHHSSQSLFHQPVQQQQQLPQIFIPEGDEGKLERRCSFVRQVEEMEKCQEGGLLDRCNHICNFEIKDKQWENNAQFYPEYERDVFGSLDYPFSECSQGRAAWQERERGRRCSLSEEARQHRIKQTEAHHRWMKKNRIHDSTYGGGSDEDDFFNVYHQSAAANALLYVGLGTTAIGSVIFFVGTGEKGFKTLELRLIGPTLIACGLLCCLIRVLLCACPSTCLRRRKKTRLKNSCPHSSSRYPLAPKYRDVSTRDNADFVPVDNVTLLLGKHNQKKKVSIVPPSHSQPSTSTTEYKDEIDTKPPTLLRKLSVPQINLPDLSDADDNSSGPEPREDSIIEMQNFELVYDIQSISSDDSDSITEIVVTESGKQPKTLTTPTVELETNAVTLTSSTSTSKLSRTRQPVNNVSEDNETCLSVVIERSDNSESSGNSEKKENSGSGGATALAASGGGATITNGDKQTHSGIVLSPLQLGQ